MGILCLDIAELDGGNAAKVDFPNANDLTNFTVTVRPDTGFWAGARYIFHFAIHQDYPHKAPKVLCQTKIYHPNIDLEGNVCLNILKEDWKPVLDINAVIYGLVYLFYEPNPDDPLNREAADLFRNDRTQVCMYQPLSICPIVATGVVSLQVDLNPRCYRSCLCLYSFQWLVIRPFH